MFAGNKELPKGKKVFLEIPDLKDMDTFLGLVQKSIHLHDPWVTPPNNEEQYRNYLERINSDAHIGFFVKTLENHDIVGVINVNEIVLGAFQSGYIGFYAFQNYNGCGFMSEGLSLLLLYYFEHLKLHRIEANVQPENKRSIQLIEKKKFRHEGFSPNYLKIGGKWKDHERFAITVEDYKKIST